MPSGAEAGAHDGGALRDLADEAAATGPVRFDRYLELALYGPHGFYTAGGRAGRRGADFITSPEVGPLFGQVLARALDAWWEEAGWPDPFVVVDAGAGPGTLVRSLLTADARCGSALRLVAVEVSPAQRALHPADPRLESRADLPPAAHVVLANELLDNVPFRLLVFDGGWREAHVSVDERAGRLVEVLRPLAGDVPAWLPANAPHGARAPWQQGAARWVADAASVAGRIVAIDYVTARTAQLASSSWREWLRTYRGHERGGHYLAAPGAQDVTTQVALDQLPEPDALRTQAQFLQLWGIDELVDEGRRAWADAASVPDLAALKMRSRVREADALLDPGGLGGFAVIEWLGGRSAL